MNRADFGMRFGLGEAPAAGSAGGGGSDQLTKELTNKAVQSVTKEGGPCDGGACGKSGAASKAATDALGPPAKPIPADQVAAVCADKSPEGQKQCAAMKKHNQEVDAQNAERKEIIEEFVKDAVGGTLTPDQIKMGDIAHSEYEKLVAKYGEKVKHMTLSEVVTAYPADAQAVVTSLGNVFPGLKGKTFEEMWALIPSTFKNMTMNDLEGAIPNSDWVGTKDSQGNTVAPNVVKAGLGMLPFLAIGALAFIFMRKGKSDET